MMVLLGFHQFQQPKAPVHCHRQGSQANHSQPDAGGEFQGHWMWTFSTNVIIENMKLNLKCYLVMSFNFFCRVPPSKF